MERSSPYPQDSDRLEAEALHRNGNYGLTSSYCSVETNHKTNFIESRPRSYGNEHYTASSYPVSQSFQYGYPSAYSTDPHRAAHFDSVAYSDSLGDLDRQGIYRPRSAEPSHAYSQYDYPSHFSPHVRPSYHEDMTNFRTPRDQYYPSETKHMLPDSKVSYPLYEEARMTFQDRSYPTATSVLPEYNPKPLETSDLHHSTGDLRSPHPLPATMGTREVEAPILESNDVKKLPDAMFEIQASLQREALPNIDAGHTNTGIIDTDPLDLRKTENWGETTHFTDTSTVSTSIAPAFDSNDLKVEGELLDSSLKNSKTEKPELDTAGSTLPSTVLPEIKPTSNTVVPSDPDQNVQNTLESIIDESLTSPDEKSLARADPEPVQEVTVEPEIIGKKKKAAVEAEIKNNLEKEARKELEASVSPDEKHRSRRKSKKPVKDSEIDSTLSEDGNENQTFHCGSCGEIFHDQELLIDHDCQNEEEVDSEYGDDEDSEDNDDDDDEDEADENEPNNEESKEEKKTPAKNQTNSKTGEESSAPPVRRSARKNKAQVRIKDISDEEDEVDPYICGECGQTFDKERVLLRHIKSHRNSDIEDYVEDDHISPSRYATRSRISRPKRNATKRKSYDYDVEESYVEPDSRSKRKKQPVVKIKTPKVPAVSTDTRKYGCAICGEISVGQDSIAQHLIDHCTEMGENDKIWECEYCDKHFSDENFLDRHIEIHELNGDQKIVKIEPVKKKEKKESTKEKKYECSTCNEVFKLKTELKAHERVHNETRKYLCVVCGEESSGKDAYLKHKKTHRTPKSYSCEECGDTFTLRSLYNQHMKTHGLKTSFDCEQCNRSFFSAGHLAIHKKGHKHAGTKKHRCQECGYQVYSEAKLMEHLESHINQDPFMCPFCGKLFMKKSTFTKHKKKHSGQNMCDVCGKAFSHKSGLDRHYTTHSGEKSFKCMYCDKSFSQQSNLSTHLRQHSGEKPFMCEICAHSFTNKCSLVRHMTKHTEGETEIHAANLARQGAVNSLSNIVLPPLPNSISHGMYTLNQFQY